MSNTVRLSILGAGSVRCMPAIVGSLATYFGERPLEVRFWDADDERLDLFDRFARHCFLFNKCTHALMSTDDPKEALEGANRVVIAIGDNCAWKYIGKGAVVAKPIQRVAQSLLRLVDQEIDALNLVAAKLTVKNGTIRKLDWPAEPSERERIGVPHQVLRFLHEDEYPHEFLRTYERSPIKDWLNDVVE